MGKCKITCEYNNTTNSSTNCTFHNDQAVKLTLFQQNQILKLSWREGLLVLSSKNWNYFPNIGTVSICGSIFHNGRLLKMIFKKGQKTQANSDVTSGQSHTKRLKATEKLPPVMITRVQAKKTKQNHKKHSEMETLHSNIEVLHTAFNTNYSESRYRLMSSSCYQMWNHYTNVKIIPKHTQWLDTDILCKTSTVCFTYTIVEKRQITALVFEKEIGIKCGAINTKNLDLTDERLKTLYRSLYLYIIPDWTFSI